MQQKLPRKKAILVIAATGHKNEARRRCTRPAGPAHAPARQALSGATTARRGAALRIDRHKPPFCPKPACPMRLARNAWPGPGA